MIYHSESGNIHIALTGDSMITRRLSVFDEPAFLELRELLQGVDAAVTNVEMLFHRWEHPPTRTPGGTYMQADPRILDELRWMGFNAFATANNHCYDFGENGLLAHREQLVRSGILFAGIGRNLGEAREPHYMDTKAGRVALISATSSGTPSMYAAHQWRDGIGRPGANMIRYTTRYTVDDETFTVLRRFRERFGLDQRIGGGAPGRCLDHSWGLSDTKDTEDRFYMRDLHDLWQYPVPDGYVFERGERPRRTLVPDTADLEENLQRIRDARRMADWVIVSFHSHEAGETADDPSEVATTFARAAIDAGADVFHGHGPHRDRGIEIYKGKPIFYSIGHFIHQNNTVSRVPLENMWRQGLDPWESTPADSYDARAGHELAGEWIGTNTSPAEWRDVVAIVEFANRRLSSIRLQPIDLGYRRARSQRGRPVIAKGKEAHEVLSLFQRLCEPYGTQIDISDDVGVIRLPVEPE